MFTFDAEVYVQCGLPLAEHHNTRSTQTYIQFSDVATLFLFASSEVHDVH